MIPTTSYLGFVKVEIRPPRRESVGDHVTDQNEEDEEDDDGCAGFER